MKRYLLSAAVAAAALLLATASPAWAIQATAANPSPTEIRGGNAIVNHWGYQPAPWQGYGSTYRPLILLRAGRSYGLILPTFQEPPHSRILGWPMPRFHHHSRPRHSRHSRGEQ